MPFRAAHAGLVSIIAVPLVACEHTSSATVASGAHDSAAAGSSVVTDSAVAESALSPRASMDTADPVAVVGAPLTVDLATRTAPIRLRGVATLRRAVVDGASNVQRRWRIVRIQWSAPTAPSLDSTTSHR